MNIKKLLISGLFTSAIVIVMPSCKPSFTVDKSAAVILVAPKPVVASSNKTIPVTSDLVAACLYRVPNRGTIPFAMVQDVIAALRETPESVFAPNANFDIYSSVIDKLGPYTTLANRAAVMGNVMLVEAAFESTWNYKEGRDQSASNTSACTEEAGLYQTSGNMNTFNAEAQAVLIPYQKSKCLSTTCEEFKRCTKEPVKSFVHGHFIRASRITVKHWGPILRKEINPYLKKECVAQLEKLL